MAVGLDAGDVREDELGKEIVERSTPGGPKDGKPLDPDEQAKLDQMEASLSDGGMGKSSSGSSPKGAGSSAGAGGGSGGFVGGLIAAGGAAAGFAGKNKKKFLVGGGISGLLVSLILGFFALLPLKIESMMKNIFNHEFNKVQYSVERRTERIFIRYAFQRVLTPGGGVVATGNPLGDLYKTWRVQNFEKTLADKYGLKIEPGNGRGHVKITTATGTIDGTDPNKVADLLDRDLNNREARAFINKTIQSETKWYQVLKRAHLRRWMRNAYAIQKWKVFDKSKGADAEKNLDKTLQGAATDGYKTRFSRYFSCILGAATSCPDKSKPGAGNSTAAASAEGDQAAAAVGDAVTSEATAATAKDLSTGVAKRLTSLVGSKFVPFIGWVDLAAHVDDFIYADRADAVVQDIRKVQYAGVFSSWLTIADQFKSGEISGDEVNVAMKKLDGIEKSNAFQTLYAGKPDAGQKITSDQKVTSTVGAKAKDLYRHSVTGVYDVTGASPAIADARHEALKFYLGSPISTVLNAITALIGKVIALIPGIDSLGKFISDVFMNLFNAVLAPIATGNEVGANLMNLVLGGADVVANDFMSSVGGHLLSPVSQQELNSAVAADQSAQAQSQGTWYRLASLDYGQSLANRIIGNLPASPGGAAQTGLTSILATIGSGGANFMQLLASAFSNGLQPAYAAVTTDPYGIDQMGFTDAELSQDVSNPTKDIAGAPDASGAPTGPDGKIDQYDCPTVPAGQANLCLLDVTTIQALQSTSTTADDGGLASDTTAAATTPTGPQAPGCTTPAPGSVSGAVAPPADYSRVSFRGVTVNIRTRTMILTAEGYAKSVGAPTPFTITQGSYNAGRVQASAGTHDGGGAVDFSVGGLSSVQIDASVKALRMAGFAAWHRTVADGFSPHIHAMAMGDIQETAIAKSQIPDYFKGLNGLASHGPDRDAAVGRPYPDWAAAFCAGKY